jgi:hypothetical protein
LCKKSYSKLNADGQVPPGIRFLEEKVEKRGRVFFTAMLHTIMPYTPDEASALLDIVKEHDRVEGQWVAWAQSVAKARNYNDCAWVTDGLEEETFQMLYEMKERLDPTVADAKIKNYARITTLRVKTYFNKAVKARADVVKVEKYAQEHGLGEASARLALEKAEAKDKEFKRAQAIKRAEEAAVLEHGKREAAIDAAGKIKRMFTGHSNPPSPKRKKMEEENIMEEESEVQEVPKTAEEDQVKVFIKVADLSKEAIADPQVRREKRDEAVRALKALVF